MAARELTVGLLLSFILQPAFAANPPTDTIRNLNAVIRMETNEANRFEVYARQADEEGFAETGKLLRALARSELILREKQRNALTSLGGKPEKVQIENVQVKSTSRNLAEHGVRETVDLEEKYANFIDQATRDKAQAAVDAFSISKTTETQHEQFFREALAGLGKAPSMDYYVNRNTGQIVAVPTGQTFAQGKTKQFEQVS